MAKNEDTDAKRAIIREWDEWSKSHASASPASGTEAQLFFSYLQRERPSLLEFRSGEQDKWQTVHGWLLRERRVKD
jgi:hypothetical protein